MAQLRQGYNQLRMLAIEVLIVGPKKPESYRNYWVKEKLPLIGLPDPTHSVMNLYRQEMKIHKLGRMPAQTLIDKNEILKFVYYGNTMADIPDINQIQKTLEA